jgi:hypothetical protein
LVIVSQDVVMVWALYNYPSRPQYHGRRVTRSQGMSLTARVFRRGAWAAGFDRLQSVSRWAAVDPELPVALQGSGRSRASPYGQHESVIGARFEIFLKAAAQDGVMS